jgi:hypothetical protein
MDDYSFGYCSICGKNKPLKNGVCIACAEKNKTVGEMPDFMKDVFGGFNK